MRGFERSAPMSTMPGGWTLDAQGKRVDASEAEREKVARVSAAFERLADNELKKGERSEGQ